MHCFWTFESIEAGRAFLTAAFADAGRTVAAGLKRPRLSYNVAIYHRTFGDPMSGRVRSDEPPTRAELRWQRGARDAAPAARPGVAFLSIALVGSVVFVLYAITVRDASQIPLLAAGGVLGLVFVLALGRVLLRAT